MSRTITQIAAAAGVDPEEGFLTEILYAVADDGTVWRYHSGNCFEAKGWRQLPALPTVDQNEVGKPKLDCSIKPAW